MTTATTTQAEVKDVMHRGVLTRSRETPLADVARTMAEKRVHCVVVDLRPVGAVSTLDVAAAVSESVSLEAMES